MSAIEVQTQSQPVSPASVPAWIKRHPVLALFVLVYAFEWAILIPQALDAQGRLPFQIPVPVQFAVGWAPGLAAIIVTAAVDGRAGVSRLLRRFLVARVNIGWYLVAVFGLGGIILGGIGLFTVFGGVAVIPAAKAALPTVAFALFATLVVGALFNTEEMAWRGVALPRLQARHSALVASLILAVPEGLSHLPYFFNPSIRFYQNVGLAAFMVFSFALTLVYTWLFNNTRGSLLLVTLLHTSQAAWANLLSDNQAGPFYGSVALLAITAVLLVAVFGPARLSRQPQPN